MKMWKICTCAVCAGDKTIKPSSREDAPDVSPRKSIMLQEMVERSASDLTPDEKEKLYQLLLECADVFAESSAEMGRTNLIKHSIDTGNSVPTPNCQLTSTTLTCNPPSTSKEAQAESQSKPINQSPEYFVTKNGVDLLKVRGTNVVKYALGLLDALYTEEELKQSSFVPVGKSTTSVKPPLSPERMKPFEDCLKQKFSASELKENVEAIRQSCTQKCRDKGKILGMILGQGGKILDKILVMIMGHVRQDSGHDLGTRRQDSGHDLGTRRQDPGHDLGTRRQDLG
ncbi:hypothetical protein EMCRGX_G024110 [Ephydatia muelleri]